MHPTAHRSPLAARRSPPTAHRLPLAALNLLLLVLAGCSTATPYQRPPVPTPQAWQWKPGEPSDHVPRGDWWKTFQDPALDSLQTDAAAHNYDLQAAMARVEQARAMARMSRADLFPSLNGSVNWARYRTSGNMPSPVPFPVPSFLQEQWSTPLDLSYEIDLWGRVRGSFEAARQQAYASEAARQSLQLIVQADVAATYFDLQNQLAEIEVLRDTVALRQEAMSIFQLRYQAGLIGDFEIERGRVEVATAEAGLQAALQRRATILNALAVLCGHPPALFSPPLSTNQYLPTVAPDLPSSLLERRPDVAEAERQLAARLAQIGVAKAAPYPALRLTGSGGFLSAEVEDLFTWDSRTWALGPSLTVPIFQGGRNLANLTKARAAYDEGIALYQQRILVAFREVEDSLAALHFLAAEAKALREAADAALASARVAFDRYRAGSLNFLDIVDAENTRLTRHLARVRIENEQRLATVRLIKALGGGWDSPAPTASAQ